MGGKLSRTKGHNFERYVAKRLRALYPEARRGLQYRDGMECSDVVGTPFHIECKRHRRVNVQKAFAQAMSESRYDPPVVVHKDDKGLELVTMELSTWEELLQLLKD